MWIGDEKFRSLGRINDVRFFIGNVEVTATVEVIDLPGKIFLLGTDWIRREKVNIDFRDDTLNVEKNGKEYNIPISYLEEGKYSDSEEEYEEEMLRSARCWLDEKWKEREIYGVKILEEKKKRYQIGNITEKQRERLDRLIKENEDIFSKDKSDLESYKKY